MKIAILNDSHFGARGDNQLFLDYFLDFFENQFFPYIKENNITEVLHLGDLMDRRKFVNFNTLTTVRNDGRYTRTTREHTQTQTLTTVVG